MNDFAVTPMGGGAKKFHVVQGLGRKVPHSEEAERHVLSGLFLDGNVCMAEALDAKLDKRAFYNAQNGVIFEALADCFARKLPLDLAVLCEELQRSGKLDAAGGMAYLVEVSSAIPTSAMFRYMLKTVVDAALLRRVLRVCDEAVEKCCEEGAVAEVEELTCKLARDVQLVADFAIRQQGVQSMADSARAAREEVLEVAEGRVDKSRQLTWPLAAIDAKFLPIDVRQEDWFNLIAAPPSGGKSALLRWLANAWLSEGKCGLVFLLETSKKRWLQALAASVVGINLRFLEDAAKLYPDRWAAFLARLAEVEAWCGERLFIYDDVFLLEDIERITEKHNRELLDAKLRAGVSEDLRKKVSGLGFVVGDYLQIVETRQRFLKKAEQLDYICPRLKKLHRRLNVPGFWGSQITRSAQNEKRRPMLYDLSDSSGLEKAADRVEFLHVPQVEGQEQTGSEVQSELIQRKSRNGPRDVAVDLVFDRALARFRAATNRAPVDAVAARMRGGFGGGVAGIGRDGRIQKGAFA